MRIPIDWATLLNNGGQTDVLLLDISKAIVKVIALKADTQTRTLCYYLKDAKMDRNLSSTPITICCGQWMPLKDLLSHIRGTLGISPWAEPIPHPYQ